MKVPLYLGLPVIALLAACSGEKESPVMSRFSPSAVVVAAGKAHGVVLAEDSGGAGMGNGHAHKTWTYFSKADGVTREALEATVDGIAEGARQEIAAMSGQVEPVMKWDGYFQIRAFDYACGGRKGSLRVTAASLRQGTAVTLIMEERAE